MGMVPAMPALWGQSARPTDRQVKAAYLYNFGHFVGWPASASSGGYFTVCILGQDPFGATLDKLLSGETVEGKPVIARRITTAAESANCQILFLSNSESSHSKQILESLGKEAVLTVSDMPQFSQQGGMIQFVLDGSRVCFEVNLPAAQRAGLSLSSDLLKVALAVRGNPAGD
jgi:hypothetical protein